jgi:sialic acid synthase SpsE
MKFVAEIGLNHDGNFDIAYELIRKAKQSGANIAKFQFGWRNKPNEINYITEDIALHLKKMCDFQNIEMLASVIDDDGLKLSQTIGLKRLKIASRTVTERPDLCKKILSEHKKVYCSLGFWKSKKFPFGEPNKNLKYIFCISKYPTYPESINELPLVFNNENYYGYSDHTHGIATPIIAISRGAKFIEKHFTLNKTSQVIRDHILSATPDEFSDLVKYGSEINKIINFNEKK